MTYQHQDFPAHRYGPNGASIIVNSEDETPKGYVDHPSKVKDAAPPAEGTKTAVQPSNGTTSAVEASKTTGATSRASTDVAKAAKAGVGGAGAANPTPPAASSDESSGANASTVTLDADGHIYDPTLHAATQSKTKAGLWRMKVGVARPKPAAGFPKPPLDL